MVSFGFLNDSINIINPDVGPAKSAPCLPRKAVRNTTHNTTQQQHNNNTTKRAQNTHTQQQQQQASKKLTAPPPALSTSTAASARQSALLDACSSTKNSVRHRWAATLISRLGSPSSPSRPSSSPGRYAKRSMSGTDSRAAIQETRNWRLYCLVLLFWFVGVKKQQRHSPIPLSPSHSKSSKIKKKSPPKKARFSLVRVGHSQVVPQPRHQRVHVKPGAGGDDVLDEGVQEPHRRLHARVGVGAEAEQRVERLWEVGDDALAGDLGDVVEGLEGVVADAFSL